MSRVFEASRRAAHGSALSPAASGAALHGPVIETFPSERDSSEAPRQPDRGFAVPDHDADPRCPPLSTGEKLVGSGNLDVRCEEQYRHVAAALHQAAQERGARTVMVASAVSGEGKTLTAANLALTLSQSYRRRVLLVDADLRRPTLHLALGVNMESGLRETLRNQSEVVPRALSEHLWFLCGGRPETNPLALLTSDSMRHLLVNAAQEFDWVVVDTPPVTVMPDAHLLVSMMDLAVFVISAGVAPEDAIRKAVASLGREKIVGVVFNRVDRAVFAHASAGYRRGHYALPLTAR